MPKTSFRRLRLASILLPLHFMQSALAAPVSLTSEGKALLPIVVAADASDETRTAAGDLAAMLSKISGAEFTVSEGDGTMGIAVGSITELPKAGDAANFAPEDPVRREEYYLRSKADGVSLIGATPLAARHAVWDLLHRLGYRQYFPGETWEYIPKNPNLSIDIDEKQAPDFTTRMIWYQYGSYRPKAVLQDWVKKNRGGAGFNLRTQHAYAGIISRNKAAFQEHPEYLALLKKGQRASSESKYAKFCISNPELRKLIVQNSLDQIEKSNPRLESISIDPSDAGGWCTCEECAKLGSISDQQVILANAVAEAVTERFPGTRIGMYAYNFHAPPPTVPVHPAIVVSVATQLNRGGFSYEQLVAGWRAKGATIGTREYFSIWTWNRSLPGTAKSARYALIGNLIQKHHEQGSRFLTAESSDDWGSSGPGYYIAARTLWDVKEGKRHAEILDELVTNLFGPAKEEMREVYRLLDGSSNIPNSEDKVGRLYRTLAEAMKKTSDPLIQKRIDDLTLFTRYIELYRTYGAAAPEADRQAAYEAVAAHALRIIPSGMVASIAVHRDLPARDKSITVPKEHRWREKNNPWLKAPPYTAEEIASMRAEGSTTNNLAGFDTLTYSDDLVPASPLSAGVEVPAGSYAATPRPPRSFLTWIAPGTTELIIESNAPRFYRLYSVGETEDLVCEIDRTGERDQKEPEMKEIRLTTTVSGLHRLVISGGAGPASIRWKENSPMTFAPDAAALWANSLVYFYVPKGTKVVGGFKNNNLGSIRDADGETIFSFSSLDKRGGHFKIDVPPGMDGKFWSARGTRAFSLLTVPNYAARSPQELLLPAEVIEADTKK